MYLYKCLNNVHQALKSKGGDSGVLLEITSYPPSTTTNVCSNYALLYPSAVTLFINKIWISIIIY